MATPYVRANSQDREFHVISCQLAILIILAQRPDQSLSGDAEIQGDKVDFTQYWVTAYDRLPDHLTKLVHHIEVNQKSGTFNTE